MGNRRIRKLRLIMRVAFGFRDTDALIGLAMLALGGYRGPTYPDARPPAAPVAGAVGGRVLAERGVPDLLRGSSGR